MYSYEERKRNRVPTREKVKKNTILVLRVENRGANKGEWKLYGIAVIDSFPILFYTYTFTNVYVLPSTASLFFF